MGILERDHAAGFRNRLQVFAGLLVRHAWRRSLDAGEPGDERREFLGPGLGERLLRVVGTAGLIDNESVLIVHVADQVELVLQASALHGGEAHLHALLLAIGVGDLLVIGLGAHRYDDVTRGSDHPIDHRALKG